MAGVFPYRPGVPPMPGPPAVAPDYMSEEKLQEKGKLLTRLDTKEKLHEKVCCCSQSAEEYSQVVVFTLVCFKEAVL